VTSTTSSLAPASEIQFDTVRTDSILPNPRGNPRKNIKQQDIDRLVESIIACRGILVPLVVFKGPRKGTYYLLDGERRLIAAKKLRLEKVPVNILPKVLEDDVNLATMFTIHMARVPWNAMARAMALNEYLELRPELEKDKLQLRKTTGMKLNEINNALLIRMFPKEIQLRAVFSEKPGGLEPSYLIELARVVEKAEDLRISARDSRTHVINAFLSKIERKLIGDPYQLKDLRNVLGNVSRKEAQEVFMKIIEDPEYGLKPLLLMYAGKVKGLRSLHIPAAKSSVSELWMSTKTQWNSLLISLLALKDAKLSPEDLKEIRKLFRQTRSAIKALI
jgi:ParB/RepB/Spo0J family partition protein